MDAKGSESERSEREVSSCKDIYPGLLPYLENKKGVESEFDDTVGATRFTLRDKQFAMLISDGTDDAALIITAKQGVNDTTLMLHPDVSERLSEGRCTIRVRLTGSVPYPLVKEMLDRGYDIVLRHFSKKIQHEILEDIWQ